MNKPKWEDRGTLVRMNWTGCQDALFMCETIQCYDLDEILTQLKASQNIIDDITKGPFRAFEKEETEWDRSKIDKWTIVLRRYHDNYNKGMEFRVFIKESIVIGLC